VILDVAGSNPVTRPKLLNKFAETALNVGAEMLAPAPVRKRVA
jgi:hypothetical protein